MSQMNQFQNRIEPTDSSRPQGPLSLIESVFVLALLAGGIASRVLPHSWNVTLIFPVSILLGAMAQRRFGALKGAPLAVALSLVMMFVSDLILGLHDGVGFVYLGVAAASMMGLILRFMPLKGLESGLVSSVVFFVISNLGVWLTSGMYTLDWNGFLLCFALAVPFFKFQLLSDAVVTAIGVVALRKSLEFQKVSYGR